MCKKLLMYNMEDLGHVAFSKSSNLGFFMSLTRKGYIPNDKTIEGFLKTIEHHKTNNTWNPSSGLKNLKIEVGNLLQIEKEDTWWAGRKYYQLKLNVHESTSIDLFDVDSYIKYFNEHQEIDYMVIQDMYTLIQILNKTDEELGRLNIDNVIIANYDVFKIDAINIEGKSQTLNDIEFSATMPDDINYQGSIGNVIDDYNKLCNNFGIKILNVDNRIAKALLNGYNKGTKKEEKNYNMFTPLLLPIANDKKLALDIVKNVYKTLTKTKVSYLYVEMLTHLIDSKKITPKELGEIIFKSKSKKNYEVLAELFDITAYKERTLSKVQDEKLRKELVETYKEYIINGNYLIGIENTIEYFTKADLKRINISEVALMAKTSVYAYKHRKEFEKILKLDVKELNTPGVVRFKQVKGRYSSYIHMTMLSVLIDSMTKEEVEFLKSEIASMILQQAYAPNGLNSCIQVVMTNNENFEIVATEIFDQLATDPNKNHIEKYLNCVVNEYRKLNDEAHSSSIDVRLRNTPLADIAFCNINHKEIQKRYVNKNL